MNIQQVIGKCARLRRDLAAAYACADRSDYQSARINRIADEIAATEQVMARSFSADESAPARLLGLAG